MGGPSTQGEQDGERAGYRDAQATHECLCDIGRVRLGILLGDGEAGRLLTDQRALSEIAATSAAGAPVDPRRRRRRRRSMTLPAAAENGARAGKLTSSCGRYSLAAASWAARSSGVADSILRLEEGGVHVVFVLAAVPYRQLKAGEEKGIPPPSGGGRYCRRSRARFRSRPRPRPVLRQRMLLEAAAVAGEVLSQAIHKGPKRRRLGWNMSPRVSRLWRGKSPGSSVRLRLPPIGHGGVSSATAILRDADLQKEH